MKMNVRTRSSGELEVDVSSLLTFPLGIPGFEQCKKFKLFYDSATDRTLEEVAGGGGDAVAESIIHRVYWLQCLDEPDVVFSVVVPGYCGVTYSVQLTDEESEILQLDGSQDPEDVVLLIMLAKDREQDGGAVEHPLTRMFRVGGTQVKPHLTGPLVLNMGKQIGIQKVLSRIRYNLDIQAD